MLRRLFLSFSVIGLALAGVTASALAYFSDSKVLGDNTFQTGNITLGDFNVASLQVTGLAPGKTVILPNIGINYVGNINADLYLGARGSSSPGEPAYLADVTYLKIKKVGTSTVVWEGYINGLSTVWRKIASDVTAGWQAYDLEFSMNTSVKKDRQNQTNGDTQILVYAIQTGGPVPATMPYETDGASGTDWSP